MTGLPAQAALICNQFRQDWLAGRRPRIEDYLSGTAEPVRTTLFVELLKLELDQRRRCAEEPSSGEYIARFPEYIRHLNESGLTGSDLSLNQTVLYQPPATDAARFELLQMVGAGAFGIVWKAHDRELDRVVALKRPRADQLRSYDPDAFLREARAVARLRHPNIVTVHQIARDEGTLFIISEYVEGGSLKARLKEQRLTPREAADLCAQVADALYHAHEQGVIHRDLKPSNILIDHDGRPLITDFGLAKCLGSDETVTFVGQIMGTIPYMSPEQADGRSHEVDARSDVFSLGVILYELLTGRRPFEGDEAVILHSIRTREPRPPRQLQASLPRDLETICLKCLAKAPAARYATAGELAEDLRRFLREEPIKARPASRLERAWRRVRRRPAVAIAMGTSLACLLLLGAMLNGGDTPAGLRSVELTTDPPGAKVHFIPLNMATGEPEPQRIIPAGSSPVRVDLPPGDYLVVAVLDDERFHEVYRHVPDTDAGRPGGYNPVFWRVKDGRVELPKITIPPTTVSAGMARIDGANRFFMGVPDSPTLPVHSRQVPSFLIDTHEFTVGDLKATIISGRLPAHLRDHSRDEPLRLPWAAAAHWAERAGKRLPDEAEYEFAATARGKQRFPWGDEAPSDADAVVSEFGRVGTPTFDRLTITDPPVCGLCSNVAEWTNSWMAPYPSQFSGQGRGVISARDFRIVRGGDTMVVGGDPTCEAKHRDPRTRTPVPWFTQKSGLGFRCVRSVQPRLRPEDFVQVLDEPQ